MKSKTTATPEFTISDHTATCLLRMAEKFFSNPANKKGFEEWHLKTYGHAYSNNKSGRGAKQYG